MVSNVAFDRRLSRILYEIYETDLDEVQQFPNSHEIDREVRLEFDDGASVFITWIQTDPLGHYGVGVFDRSQFSPPIPVVLDVSAFPIWAPLKGEAVWWSQLDRAGETLRVRSASHSVYISTGGIDRLAISGDFP